MIDELLLLSGNEIPFPIARLTIYPPRLKEIAFIGENNFWQGCELLKFDKNILNDQAKSSLSNQSNFNIIMSMIQEKRLDSQQARINILSVLALIFPTYQIKLGKKTIQLYEKDTEDVKEINQNNFEVFKSILIEMFCLKDSEKQYDPSGAQAKRIADQIMRGRQKRAELASKTEKISILSRYASILAVGEQKDINSLMDYTVYQIMDEFTRYQLKLQNDMYDRWRRAGATGLEGKEPDDWLKDIHKKK